MRSRRHRIAVMAAVVFVFGLVVREGNRIYYIEPPFATLLDTSFENFTAVQIGSFKTSMAELLIIDLAYKDAQTQRISINRRMVSGERNEIFITELAMLVPANITEAKHFDTSQLRVDYRKLNGVGQALVAPPFLMGSLKADKESVANVLVIGIGGSQLNNFIHYNFPRLNITAIELEQPMVDMAKKYFGLKEDANQRVIVMDGIKFLEEAVEKGLKYDAIFIDVCPTRFPRELTVMCPIPPMLDERVIRQIRQCLKESGTMISKMLVFTVRVVEESEEVLVCSGEKVPKERFNLDLLLKSKAKFYEDLGVRT
ncbi:unnamed protein product [Toxocara canis]|uniref:PABS domain-containing protein n=1 Tax=Toxocara canis TaxID=6265 RepID=A0A183V0N5_TOXCA|nr:unnamed protein product [Toxocara canis]